MCTGVYLNDPLSRHKDLLTVLLCCHGGLINQIN